MDGWRGDEEEGGGTARSVSSVGGSYNTGSVWRLGNLDIGIVTPLRSDCFTDASSIPRSAPWALPVLSRYYLPWPIHPMVRSFHSLLAFQRSYPGPPLRNPIHSRWRLVARRVLHRVPRSLQGPHAIQRGMYVTPAGNVGSGLHNSDPIWGHCTPFPPIGVVRIATPAPERQRP